MSYSRIVIDKKLPWHASGSSYPGGVSGMAQSIYEDVFGSDRNSTPGWHKLPRSAQMVPKNYVRTFRRGSGGSLHQTTTSYTGELQTQIDGPGPIGLPLGDGYGHYLPEVVETCDYLAVSRLLTTARGEGANIANMLGERKQVANSVSTMLKTIAYSARDLRRGNIAAAIRRFGGDPKTARSLRGKDIAQAWLSMQYGWKPLLSDMYDLVQGLHHREKTHPKILRGSKSAIGMSDSTESHTLDHLGRSCGKRSTAATVKYVVRAYPDIALAEPAALGFTNPLGVLWEITPWSFVVDWALPIGSYLDQLTASHGWNFYDGCRTEMIKSGQSWSIDESWTTPLQSTSWGWFGSSKWDRFSHGVLNDFPSAQFPHFKNPFSITHVENALALLAQAFNWGGQADRLRSPPRNLRRG